MFVSMCRNCLNSAFRWTMISSLHFHQCLVISIESICSVLWKFNKHDHKRIFHFTECSVKKFMAKKENILKHSQKINIHLRTCNSPDAIKQETYCGICSSVFYSRHSPFSLTSAPDLMAQIPTVWSLEAVKMADELVAMELMGLL